MAEKNELQICVEADDSEATGCPVPVVKILIDGEDVFSGLSRNGFIGFDPDELFGPEQPLVPTEPPRRVAVYRCSCGEPGCGVVAPIVSRTDPEIRWTDFEDFTGWFNRPISPEEPQNGRPLALASVIFDAGQYLNEVRRATSDRTWESPLRRTARALKDILNGKSDQLAESGLTLDWVFPSFRSKWNVDVSFRDADHRYTQGPTSQFIVTLRAGLGSTEDRAAEMASRLLSKRPVEWAEAFPWSARNTG